MIKEKKGIGAVGLTLIILSILATLVGLGIVVDTISTPPSNDDNDDTNDDNDDDNVNLDPPTNDDDNNNDNTPQKKVYTCYMCEQGNLGDVVLIKDEGWSCGPDSGILYTATLSQCEALHPEYYDSNDDNTDPPTNDDTNNDDPLGQDYIHFDGYNTYIEINDADKFSVGAYGGTIIGWIRPDTKTFPKNLMAGYIHWLGKGYSGQHEWVLRIYNEQNGENRPNRQSCYVYNLDGGLGAGSYAEYGRNTNIPFTVGEWRMIVAKYDGSYTHFYLNGQKTDSDSYSGYSINAQNGIAPVRIGTREKKSFFSGDMSQVAFFDEPLSDNEIANIYSQGPFYDMRNTQSSNNLFAYYPMKASGTTVYDRAGNHHGRLYGG